MKKVKNRMIVILCLIMISIISNSQTNKKVAPNITFYITTDIVVDSVLFTNMTQDREYHFFRFADTMKLTLKDSINDLYDLTFFTKSGKIRSRNLWLDGENLIIKGRLSKKLEIDTVIGSKLYYTSVNFFKNYSELFKKGVDSLVRNDFLLDAVRTNIENPFSIDPARIYYMSNQSNTLKLKLLYDILLPQSRSIKNHKLSFFEKIEKTLTITKINIGDYAMKNLKNESTFLSLEKGKKYILDFWFTNCPPCVKDHILLKDSLLLLKANNIDLIGISTDSDINLWTSYLKKNKYNWLNFIQTGEENTKMTTHLSINVYPTYILINDEGNILMRTSNINELLDLLRRKN